MAPGTDMGPLVNAEAVETIDRQVRDTVAAGARLVTGGKPLAGPGHFYPPTLIADIPDGSPAHHEELFGPVASLFVVGDVDDAIALANATDFGLGAAAWTQDDDEKERFANEIEAGAVFLNGMTASDPRLPFGGVKRSGYGRELGRFGIREFVNVKTVVED
jgi:succinate-semialdehyde dehydrogenase/glutarate-semialdehyde dehydrogenase